VQQILIIDDSKPIHDLVKALLADEAVEIHSALDAERGLVLAASLQPDLILLDVDMPTMNGFDACRAAKADRTTAGIPIIFLTSVSMTDEKVRGLELGAVDYVTKPFNRAELWARVRAALRTSHLVRILEKKALLDPLTGLGNRAMFDRLMTAEVSRRGRFGDPLSCILVAVDALAVINGAACGSREDQALQRVAELIAGVCRPEEVACRYGEREFVVIAPHVSAQEALALADRLKAAVARAEWMFQGVPVRLSASFAVADAANLYDRSMVQRAEDALHLVKQQAKARAGGVPGAAGGVAA
jgi:diguanylate cyclase (GGDEF)-like protein